MVNFAQIIKNLRCDKGWSQLELAEKLHIPRYIIGNWESERSNPALDDLVKVADIFQVSVDYLIGREDELGNVTISVSPEVSLRREESELLTRFRKLKDEEKSIILKQLTALIK